MSTIIIDVALSPENAAAKAAELARSIQAIKDQQTILNATNKKASQEYADNAAKLKTLTQEQKAYTIIAKEAVGSNNQLRAQLTLLTNQYNAMGKAERDTTTAGKALLAQTRAISDELKKNEKAVGDNRRNVGNYVDVLNQASAAGIPFAGTIAQMTGNFSSLSSILTASVGSMSALGGALLGAGSAAVALVAVPLVAYFGSTQEGMERMTRAIQPFKNAITIAFGELQELGRSTAGWFDTLLGKIQSIGGKGSGMGTAQSPVKFNYAGEFASDVDQKKADEFARKAKEMADIQIQINKNDAENILQKATLNRLFKEQSEIARDASKEENIRIEAAKKGIAALNEWMTLESEDINLKIKLLKLEQSLTVEGPKSLAGIKAMNTLLAEKADLEAETYGKRVKLTSVINKTEAATAKEQDAAAKTELANLEKAAEAYKKKAEIQLKFFQDIQTAVKAQLDNEKRMADFHQKEKDDLAKQVNDINAKNQQGFDKNRIALEKHLAEVDALNLASFEAEKMLQLEKLAVAGQIASGLEGLFKENSAAQKAAFLLQKAIAIAQIILSYQVAKAAAIAGNTLAIPVFGFFKGLTEGVLIQAQEIASLALVAGTTIKGFSDGGLVKGAGTSKSDSIPARLSTGESVINARSTEMFAPILSQINQAGGGRAFDNMPRGSFALGGIAQGSYITSLSETSQQANQMNALMNTLKMLPPPIVDVRQIILESQKFAATQVRQNV